MLYAGHFTRQRWESIINLTGYFSGMSLTGASLGDPDLRRRVLSFLTEVWPWKWN